MTIIHNKVIETKQNVIQVLEKLGINYKLTHHEPVFTMEQASKICGHRPEEGIKTLLAKIYKTKKDKYFVLVVWRGEQKVDLARLSELLNAKEAKLASKEEVFECLGIEVGSLTPFGYSKKLPVVFNKSILENKRVFINPGRHDETIEMSSQDLTKAILYWLNGSGNKM